MTGTQADSRPRVVAGLRLVRLAGRGAEGEVWEARDEHGRRRALKLIRPEMLAEAGEVARRAAFLRRIDHPALVRVHRSGILAGSTLGQWGFVEMDYVDGDPLSDAPPDPEMLRRLRPLADALDDLHAGVWSDGLPLVHRDVKPANLIATPRGEVVLVDCSTLRGADATQLTRVGTPVFAAPEVLRGRMGPAADVYSFAVTVVALVTGARGNALAELVDRPWAVDLPEAVGRALSPYPAERPTSCAAVLESGSTIRLDRARPRRQRETRAWPWLAALCAVIASAAAPRAGLVSHEWGLAAAAGVHLAAHLAARRRLLPAVALPPVAWAFLLAERSGWTRPARYWLRGALTGVLTATTAGLAAITTPESIGIAAAGATLSCLAVGAARTGADAGRLALRWLLLPAWTLGAALLVAGGVAGLPVAAFVGQGRATVRLIGRTLASARLFAGDPLYSA